MSGASSSFDVADPDVEVAGDELDDAIGVDACGPLFDEGFEDALGEVERDGFVL